MTPYSAPVSLVRTDSACKLTRCTLKCQFRCSNAPCSELAVERMCESESGLSHRIVVIRETVSWMVLGVQSCIYRSDWASEVEIHAQRRLKASWGPDPLQACCASKRCGGRWRFLHVYNFED